MLFRRAGKDEKTASEGQLSYNQIGDPQQRERFFI
jgi:hypothetical protein